MAKKRHYPRMPHETQKTAAWYVKTYPRLVLEYNAIINGSPAPPDIPGRSSLPADPTGIKAAKLEAVSDKIKAIEYARDRLPYEYRQAVWNNAVLGSPFPDHADRKTWEAYKNDFLFIVAVLLGLPLEV